MSRDNGGGDFFKGFLLGGAIGAIIALLYAPKSGKEMREDIRRGAGELYDDASEKAREFRDKAEEVVADARRQAEALRAQAEAKIAEARAKADQLISEGRSKAHNLVEQGAKIVEREKGRVKSALDAGAKAYREEADGNKAKGQA